MESKLNRLWFELTLKGWAAIKSIASEAGFSGDPV
jgi:hypothetical protein